jgi:hypothetical protein
LTVPTVTRDEHGAPYCSTARCGLLATSQSVVDCDGCDDVVVAARADLARAEADLEVQQAAMAAAAQVMNTAAQATLLQQARVEELAARVYPVDDPEAAAAQAEELADARAQLQDLAAVSEQLWSTKPVDYQAAMDAAQQDAIDIGAQQDLIRLHATPHTHPSFACDTHAPGGES